MKSIVKWLAATSTLLLPPQGDARSDRAAHRGKRHSAAGKRRCAGRLERQGRERRLSGDGITPVCGCGLGVAWPTRRFTCGIVRAALELGDGSRPSVARDDPKSERTLRR